MVPDRPSRTAEAVSLMRAFEASRNPEVRIVDDPYARGFLGPIQRTVLASWEAATALGDVGERFTAGVTTFVLCRHRFIDEALRVALLGNVEQVVILGAGYDSRAWRFTSELGGRPVFEVDFPATSRRKSEIVANLSTGLPATNRVAVEIDFQTETLDEVLCRAGFRPQADTFTIWEGVAMYLTRDAVKQTLRSLQETTGPGSGLVFDLWYYIDSPDALSTVHRISANLLHLLGEPVTFSLHPEDAPPFLDGLGYEVEDLADGGELERRFVNDSRAVGPGVYVVHARRRESGPRA